MAEYDSEENISIEETIPKGTLVICVNDVSLLGLKMQINEGQTYIIEKVWKEQGFLYLDLKGMKYPYRASRFEIV